jgi:hypothetical protein
MLSEVTFSSDERAAGKTESSLLSVLNLTVDVTTWFTIAPGQGRVLGLHSGRVASRPSWSRGRSSCFASDALGKYLGRLREAPAAIPRHHRPQPAGAWPLA